MIETAESSAKERLLRASSCALGGFAGLTMSWIVCGLATGGDFFGQGSAAGPFMLVAALGAGGYLGLKARRRWLRVLLAALGAGSIVFWVAAPNGWWALPPPSPSEVRVGE